MGTLQFGTTSHFKLLYNDKGSGSNRDGSFYRPVPRDDFRILGDYGQGNYNAPRGTVVTVRETDPNPRDPLLASPVDFVRIWTDKGSGGDRDGSFWQPVPPDGYVALGSVCENGYHKPHLDNYACLRRDLVRTGRSDGLIWNDKGSGADQDVSVYGIKGIGVIHAQGNYGEPSQLFVPKKL